MSAQFSKIKKSYCFPQPYPLEVFKNSFSAHSLFILSLSLIAITIYTAFASHYYLSPTSTCRIIGHTWIEKVFISNILPSFLTGKSTMNISNVVWKIIFFSSLLWLSSFILWLYKWYTFKKSIMVEYEKLYSNKFWFHIFPFYSLFPLLIWITHMHMN